MGIKMIDGCKELPKRSYLWLGKMIGELKLVFMIRDKDVGGELDIAHTLKYTWAMVKFLQ